MKINHLKKGSEKLYKVFIQKRIKWTNFGINNYPIYSCGSDLIHSLNAELYDAVHKKADGYYYSQSYWDKNDDSLIFTDSYWENPKYLEDWLNSKERKDVLKKYEQFIDIDTSYHILITQRPFDIPLL